MKAKLLNLIAKLTGLSKLWEKTRGLVTYTAGGAAILTGAAGLLLQLNGCLSGQDAACLLDLAKGLPENPNWLTILGGFAAVGLRRAVNAAPEVAK